MEKAGLEGEVARHFNSLSMRGKIIAEYIWVGGNGGDLRSKTRVLSCKPRSVEELPVGHFDGRFTEQCPLDVPCPTIYLQPRMMVPDPFRGGDHILVLCETYCPATNLGAGNVEVKPHHTNNRAPCDLVMRQAAHCEPLFTVEQQYTLLDPSTSIPIGWPERGFFEAAPSSYCGVGLGAGLGREFAEAHFRACLHADLEVSGTSSEVMPGQWSFKVGPCKGAEIGDQVWMARYLLSRCSEKFNLKSSLDPKPVPGDWPICGAFVKYSTTATRCPMSGWKEINRHVKCLESNHFQDMMVYGSNRMQSQGKVAVCQPFSWALEGRNASLRIPQSTLANKRGYYEDRRPAANMDPYLGSIASRKSPASSVQVSMMLVRTTLGIPLPLSGEQVGEMSDESSTDASQGSSAILSELDRQDSFAPETPPQNMSLLGSETTSRCQ